MRSLAPLALMLVLAACAPATTVGRYNPVEGSRVFTLSVDGQPVGALRGTFAHRTQDFDLEVRLTRVGLELDLVNTSESTIRLNLGRSAIILPDGSRSGVVTRGTPWSSRDDPQPTADIPQRSKAMVVLLPRTLLRLQSEGGGLDVEPMFEWPLSSTVTIRLLLSVEVDGSEREIALVFEGTPTRSAVPEG